MKHILSLSDFLITEKLSIVDNDVDFLYNTYFRTDIETILSDKTTKNLFNMEITNTSFLEDELSISADKINHCEIAINSKNMAYNPTESVIYLSINKSAYNFTRGFNTLSEAIEKIPHDQLKSFKLEFSETKIKSSIHHELAHWIDDSLHNKHIKKAIEADSGKGRMKGLPNVNLSKIEIEAIVHNIYQLKRKYLDIWDTISFNDMVDLSPSLITLKKTFSYQQFNDWKRQVISRMNREGLIGKAMFI